MDGSVGKFFWVGYAGTYFWVDQKKQLVGVYMMQSVKHLRTFAADNSGSVAKWRSFRHAYNP
jgi:CubicO group peptidase (beta-lactamase class C family)